MKSLWATLVLACVAVSCWTHCPTPLPVGSSHVNEHSARAATQPAFKTWISPDHFDERAIMGEPPKDDSPEHRAEIEKMLALHAHITPAEQKRCASEVDVNVFAFSSVLGDDFTAKNLPQTAALMKEVYEQTKVVSGGGKKVWKRPRPYDSIPNFSPAVEKEPTFSYPSGHATRGVVWATLLAEIYPDQREKLLAKGKEIGTDRSLAGVHWPSDVVAGQKLGMAIADQLLKDDDFKAELAKVKEECLAVHH